MSPKAAAPAPVAQTASAQDDDYTQGNARWGAGYYADLDGPNTRSDVTSIGAVGRATLPLVDDNINPETGRPYLTTEITQSLEAEPPSLLERAWNEIKAFARDEWNTVSEWLDGAGLVAYEPRYQFANPTVDFALSPLTTAVKEVYNTGATAINLAVNAPALAVGLATRNDLQRANEIIVQGTQALGPMGAPFAPLAMAASSARGAAAMVGAARASSSVALSAAQEAAAWQGSPRFPGVDRWRDITLRKGTIIYAGEPGLSGFMTTQSAVRRSGGMPRPYLTGCKCRHVQGCTAMVLQHLRC